MSSPPAGKNYRVVGVHSDGRQDFIQGNLPKDVAEAVQSMLQSVFPTVLIEDDASPFVPPLTVKVKGRQDSA
ncbi:MAG TPA: hypothetical protein VL475_03660 [Planctomycetaceae bacterium]|nr:hypothetical protein [Planctomycetaceae bacterium]